LVARRVDSPEARSCYGVLMTKPVLLRQTVLLQGPRTTLTQATLPLCERTHACIEGDANPLDDVHKDFLPLLPGGVVCHHRLGDSSPWDTFAWVHEDGGSPQIGQLLDVELDRLVEDVGFQGLGGSGLGIPHVLQDQAGFDSIEGPQ
jgi:hypothetical protein